MACTLNHKQVGVRSCQSSVLKEIQKLAEHLVWQDMLVVIGEWSLAELLDLVEGLIEAVESQVDKSGEEMIINECNHN